MNDSHGPEVEEGKAKGSGRDGDTPDAGRRKALGRLAYAAPAVAVLTMSSANVTAQVQPPPPPPPPPTSP